MRMLSIFVVFNWMMITGLNAAATGGSQVEPFRCPAQGNFTLPDVNDCRKYHACEYPGELVEPLECQDKFNFDRFSRICQPKDRVNCNLCSQDGYFPDLTSKPHFIQCQNRIPLRYHCKHGDYSWKTGTCGGSDTPIKTSNDGVLDMPTDHDNYILSWRDEYARIKKSGKGRTGRLPPDGKYNPTIDTFVKPEDTIPNCDWSISGYMCVFSLLICAVCGIAEIS